VRGKELQVAKKRVGRYPNEFRRMAVERLKSCENIVALSQELGVHHDGCCTNGGINWTQLNRGKNRHPRTHANPHSAKEVHQLKRLLADKTLEVDFFKGALQKVEARRQRKESSGEKASTTKSGT
jgi:transposase-like protein